MVSKVTPCLSFAGHYHLTFEEFFLFAKQQGFNSVQIIPDQYPNLYSDLKGYRLNNLRTLKQSLDIEIHVHNVFYDINLVSLVPEVRAFAFDITRKILEISSELSAKTLTVHLGYIFPGWSKDNMQNMRFWEVVKQSLEQLYDLSKQFQIPILIENGSYYLTTATSETRTPLHLGISPYELHYLLSLSNNTLGIAFDINKAIQSGYPIDDFILQISSSIRQVQFSTLNRYEDVIRVIKAISLENEAIVVIFEGGPLYSAQALKLLNSLGRE